MVPVMCVKDEPLVLVSRFKQRSLKLRRHILGFSSSILALDVFYIYSVFSGSCWSHVEVQLELKGLAPHKCHHINRLILGGNYMLASSMAGL